MIELRNGINNLDMLALGRELCKAYLIYDPFPKLPAPNEAFNLFRSIVSILPYQLQNIINVPTNLFNDMILGSKCLLPKSHSNSTKFINLLYLKYSNYKLSTTFNLATGDYVADGNEIAFVIIGFNNFFIKSFDCFNTTSGNYYLKGSLLDILKFLDNAYAFLYFYQNISSTCSKSGDTPCYRFHLFY